MADKRGRCSSPLIIRARHIAHAPPHRQPSFPPAPTPGTHRLPQSAWRGGTASKENEFLSPSSWPFHKNLFACRSRHRCACSFHTGCRSTACRGQQDVLAAGPNCPGATETWADGGGRAKAPKKGDRGAREDRRQGAPAHRATPGTQLEFSKGAISGWDGLYVSPGQGQIREIMESIL